MVRPPAERSRSFTTVKAGPRAWVYGGWANGTGLLVLFAVLLGHPLTSADQPSVNATEPLSIPVEVAQLEPVTSYQVQRIYTGEVAAARTSNLGFERSGSLVEILVDEGQQVMAGTPLASLDVQNLQAQRTQLLAQIDQAQALLSELETGPRAEDIAAAEAAVRDLEKQLVLQQIQRERRQSLYDQGAISREQLDEFSFGVEALEARIDQAQSNLAIRLNGTRPEQITAQRAVVEQLQAAVTDLDITLSKSTLVAPFAGIVSTRQVNEGTVISSGQPVIRLVELDTPEARIGLPVMAVNRLSVGESHSIRINDQDRSAEIITLLPEVDPTTRTRTVVLTLNGLSVAEVAPGETVRWELPEVISVQGEAFWLPTDALTQGLRGLWSCYVIQPAESNAESDTPSFAVSQQSVEVLHQDGDQVLVRGLLQSGDQVVISGVHRLVPGQLVSPIDTQANQASF